MPTLNIYILHIVTTSPEIRAGFMTGMTVFLAAFDTRTDPYRYEIIVSVVGCGQLICVRESLALV